MANFWGKKGDDDVPPGDKDSGAAVSAPASKSVFTELVERQGTIDTGGLDAALDRRFGSIRAALGVGTVIQGKLSFDSNVRIDGQLSGEIFCSKALIVGPTGRVDARVDAGIVIVFGQVKGVLTARDRLEVMARGVLEGEVRTPTFVLEDGAVFNGKCQMIDSALNRTAADDDEDDPGE